MITLLHWLFLPHLTVPLECEIAERCRRMGRVRRMRLEANPHPRLDSAQGQVLGAWAQAAAVATATAAERNGRSNG